MDLLTHATVCAECARALSTLPAAGVHCLSCLKARRFLLYLCDRQGALDLHWIYKGGFDNWMMEPPPNLRGALEERGHLRPRAPLSRARGARAGGERDRARNVRVLRTGSTDLRARRPGRGVQPNPPEPATARARAPGGHARDEVDEGAVPRVRHEVRRRTRGLRVGARRAAEHLRGVPNAGNTRMNATRNSA